MRTAMRQMVGVFGQLEKSMIVARLRRGRRMKAELGGRAVGASPFGYTAEGGELVPDDQQQRAITRIREMRGTGRSYRDIAATFNTEGIGSKRGRSWHPMTVRRVLEREATR
ncbi:MAG: recombinase family protein [Actinomycetota bacterium]|nr:recombinase family protein [Actinomycetota bacterium]